MHFWGIRPGVNVNDFPNTPVNDTLPVSILCSVYHAINQCKVWHNNICVLPSQYSHPFHSAKLYPQAIFSCIPYATIYCIHIGMRNATTMFQRHASFIELCHKSHTFINYYTYGRSYITVSSAKSPPGESSLVDDYWTVLCSLIP